VHVIEIKDSSLDILDMEIRLNFTALGVVDGWPYSYSLVEPHISRDSIVSPNPADSIIGDAPESATSTTWSLRCEFLHQAPVPKEGNTVSLPGVNLTWRMNPGSWVSEIQLIELMQCINHGTTDSSMVHLHIPLAVRAARALFLRLRNPLVFVTVCHWLNTLRITLSDVHFGFAPDCNPRAPKRSAPKRHYLDKHGLRLQFEQHFY
jgi:hypothetical protein